MADSVIDCSPMSEVSTASTTAHTEENHVDESPRGIAVMVVVGVLVGLLSGLFGIGGGTIIVPALVWLGLTQRHAAATCWRLCPPRCLVFWPMRLKAMWIGLPRC